MSHTTNAPSIYRSTDNKEEELIQQIVELTGEKYALNARLHWTMNRIKKLQDELQALREE